MTRSELDKAIQDTKLEIEDVKLELSKARNASEERRLLKRLKELQTLQLWHLDQTKIIERREHNEKNPLDYIAIVLLVVPASKRGYGC